MFTLKIFYLRYRFTGENTCRIKKHLCSVKLIMRKVSYIPLDNILADDLLSRMSRRGCIFDRRGGCQFTFFEKVALASTRHERTTLVALVSYKHNVAAKHVSSKLLTTNELWLLELQIKSTRILASIPRGGARVNLLGGAKEPRGSRAPLPPMAPPLSIPDALWDMCKSSIVRWFRFSESLHLRQIFATSALVIALRTLSWVYRAEQRVFTTRNALLRARYCPVPWFPLVQRGMEKNNKIRYHCGFTS